MRYATPIAELSTRQAAFRLWERHIDSNRVMDIDGLLQDILERKNLHGDVDGSIRRDVVEFCALLAQVGKVELPSEA